jgi:hypothetical protein
LFTFLDFACVEHGKKSWILLRISLLQCMSTIGMRLDYSISRKCFSEISMEESYTGWLTKDLWCCVLLVFCPIWMDDASNEIVLKTLQYQLNKKNILRLVFDRWTSASFFQMALYIFFLLSIVEICLLNIKMQKTIPIHETKVKKLKSKCTKFKNQVTKINKREVCSKWSKWLSKLWVFICRNNFFIIL